MNTTPKQRVLLTGAAGSVTSAIGADLKRDYNLVLTDAYVPDDRQDEMAHLDLLDFPAVCDAMQNIDQVIHLAIAIARALRHLPHHEYIDEIMRVNMMGTQHVYEAAVRAGVKRAVYFSSMTVWLGQPSHDSGRIIQGTTPLRPHRVYGCTKLFGEQLADDYTRNNDISIICLRLGQPIPAPAWEHGSKNVQDFAYNGVMCDFEDITQGVRCALNATDIKYHIFPVVSASPGNRVDLTEGLKVGFWPKKCFNLDGSMIDNPVPMPESIP
jgi:uronate dehydrogenase